MGLLIAILLGSIVVAVILFRSYDRMVEFVGVAFDRTFGQPVRLAMYGALAAAFYCFWMAESRFREEPFEEGQWRLLGFTLVVIGAAVGWRSRRRE